MHKFNTTLNKIEAEKEPIKLVSAKESYEELAETIGTDYFDMSRKAKMEFKAKILGSLNHYRNEYKNHEQSQRQKLVEITEVVDASIYKTKIESITQRLMVHDMFNDYCDAKFYTKFKRCDESTTPDISNDYVTFAKRITDMQIDENLFTAERNTTSLLDECVIINDTKSKDDISPIDIFKQTKTVDLRLADFMDLNGSYRHRISSIFVQPVDASGKVILNKRRVKIQVIFPAKFTDTDQYGRKYDFVIRQNICKSEYDKALHCKYIGILYSIQYS